MVFSPPKAELPKLAVTTDECQAVFGVDWRTLQANGCPHIQWARKILIPVDPARQWLAEQAAQRSDKP